MFFVCIMTECTVCTCFSAEMAREIFFRVKLGIGFYDRDTGLNNLLSGISTSQPSNLLSPMSVDYESYARTTRLFVPSGSLGSSSVHPFIDLLPFTSHSHTIHLGGYKLLSHQCSTRCSSPSSRHLPPTVVPECYDSSPLYFQILHPFPRRKHLHS